MRAVPRYPAELIERLCIADPNGAPPRAMIIVAHPDDEVIGAGSRLPWLAGAIFVHVTDGAPRDLYDARAAGFATHEAYAAARRQELIEALYLANVSRDQLVALNIPDREAAFNLARITTSITQLILSYEPGLILTHAYEGGHPDHDSVGFCVRKACDMLRQRETRPVILEMAFYHQGDNGLDTGSFLPGPEARTIWLSESQWEMKARMLGCFRSQRFLQFFYYKHERFRMAPVYNFELAPHEGELFYETLNWNFFGAQWRSLAREAARHLDDMCTSW